eukprot:536250-Amphidinium_carterae.1
MPRLRTISAVQPFAGTLVPRSWQLRANIGRALVLVGSEGVVEKVLGATGWVSSALIKEFDLYHLVDEIFKHKRPKHGGWVWYIAIASPLIAPSRTANLGHPEDTLDAKTGLHSYVRVVILVGGWNGSSL